MLFSTVFHGMYGVRSSIELLNRPRMRQFTCNGGERKELNRQQVEQEPLRCRLLPDSHLILRHGKTITPPDKKSDWIQNIMFQYSVLRIPVQPFGRVDNSPCAGHRQRYTAAVTYTNAQLDCLFSSVALKIPLSFESIHLIGCIFGVGGSTAYQKSSPAATQRRTA